MKTKIFTLCFLITSHAMAQNELKKSYDEYNKQLIDQKYKMKTAGEITQCLRNLVNIRDPNMEGLTSSLRILEVARKSPKTQVNMKKWLDTCKAALKAVSFCEESTSQAEQLKFLEINSSKISPHLKHYLKNIISPSVYHCRPLELDATVALLGAVSAKAGVALCTLTSGERYLSSRGGIGVGGGLGFSLAAINEDVSGTKISDVYYSYVETVSLGFATSEISKSRDEANYVYKRENNFAKPDKTVGVGLGATLTANLNFKFPVLPLTQDDGFCGLMFTEATK